MKPELKRKIGNPRCGPWARCAPALFSEVGVEGICHGLNSRDIGRVGCELLESLPLDSLQEGNRVVVAGVPSLWVDGLEQLMSAGLPAPPEVFSERVERSKHVRQHVFSHGRRGLSDPVGFSSGFCGFFGVWSKNVTHSSVTLTSKASAGLNL